MRDFAIRFIIFILLWLGMIVMSVEQSIFSILMFTLSLLMFFFLSKPNTGIYLYIALSIVTFLHGYVLVESLYSSMLLLLIVFIAIPRCPNIKFYLLFAMNIMLSVMLVYLQPVEVWLHVLIGGLIVLLIIKIRSLNMLQLKLDYESEQLKTQYRTLKRMNITAEDIARTEERTRIAREIHDSVGHQLTALMMKLEMLQIENPHESYTELKAMAKSSLRETRYAVETLQGKEVQGLGAVVQLIRKLEAENQLLITFTMKEGILSLPLSNTHSVVLYRVIQEALTNVMRHADTKQVNILIGKSVIHSLTFKISNKVVNPQKIRQGFGLKNMQARVMEVGGKLDVYQTEEKFIIEGMMPYE